MPSRRTATTAMGTQLFLGAGAGSSDPGMEFDMATFERTEALMISLSVCPGDSTFRPELKLGRRCCPELSEERTPPGLVVEKIAGMTVRSKAWVS
jgi:hypothetical protein